MLSSRSPLMKRRIIPVRAPLAERKRDKMRSERNEKKTKWLTRLSLSQYYRAAEQWRHVCVRTEEIKTASEPRDRGQHRRNFSLFTHLAIFSFLSFSFISLKSSLIQSRWREWQMEFNSSKCTWVPMILKMVYFWRRNWCHCIYFSGAALYRLYFQ